MIDPHTYTTIYFEKLIKSGELSKSKQLQEPDSTRVHSTLSPIEALFHQHLKKSLSTYEEYYQVHIVIHYITPTGHHKKV